MRDHRCCNERPFGYGGQFQAIDPPRISHVLPGPYFLPCWLNQFCFLWELFVLMCSIVQKDWIMTRLGNRSVRVSDFSHQKLHFSAPCGPHYQKFCILLTWPKVVPKLFAKSVHRRPRKCKFWSQHSDFQAWLWHHPSSNALASLQSQIALRRKRRGGSVCFLLWLLTFERG